MVVIPRRCIYAYEPEQKQQSAVWLFKMNLPIKVGSSNVMKNCIYGVIYKTLPKFMFIYKKNHTKLKANSMSSCPPEKILQWAILSASLMLIKSRLQTSIQSSVLKKLSGVDLHEFRQVCHFQYLHYKNIKLIKSSFVKIF